MCRLVLGLAGVALATSQAQAQQAATQQAATPPAPPQSQISVYGQATGDTIHFANTGYLYGATVGIFDTKRAGPLDIGPDVRVSFTQRGATQGPLSDAVIDYGQFGLRAGAARGAIPFAHSLMPYAEATVGVAYWRGGVGTTREDGKHSVLQLAGGIDYHIVKNIAWRVAEFTYARVGAVPGHINPASLSSGFVIQLR
jgi:hypothetical protein